MPCRVILLQQLTLNGTEESSTPFLTTVLPVIVAGLALLLAVILEVAIGVKCRMKRKEQSAPIPSTDEAVCDTIQDFLLKQLAKIIMSYRYR